MTREHTPSNEPASDGMASLLGRSFALIQHGMDRVIEWGFAKMQEVPKEDKTFENPTLRKAAKAGRSVLRFFGGMGKAYYEHYEELKADAKRKSSHAQ